MKRKNRRFIHVFAGIDALSVAKPDWDAIAFSEIEPFACAVLAHHHPDVPNLGDITKIDFTQFAGSVDIWAGGSPCQAFSIAGLRKSLNDARGNVGHEYIRGFNESECPIGLWENVPGVLTTDDNAFGLFIAGMVGESSMLFPDDKQAEKWLEAEFINTILCFNLALVDFRFFRTYRGRHPKIKWGNAGMVFGPKGSFAWRVLDAQYFSLPQRRERVFGVAFRPRNAHRLLGAAPTEDLTRFLGLPGAVLFEQGGVSGHITPRRQARQKASAASQGSTGGDSGSELRRSSTSGGMDSSACACDRGGGDNSDRLRGDIGRSAVVYESIGYNPVDVSPTLDAGCKDGPIRNQQAPFVACIKGAAIGRQPQNGPQRGEIRDDGIVYTLNATEVHAVCFQQNTRDEVRLINGDGQLAGAIMAEPGMKQQNYLAFSYKDYGDDAGVISPTLRSGGFKTSHSNSGAPPAICYHLTFCDANGRRKDRVNGGLYVNETDKSNALTAGDPGYATVICLKDTSNLFVEKQDGVGQDGLAFTLDTRGRAGCLTPWDYQRVRIHADRGIAPCLFNNGDGGGNEAPSVFALNILRRFSPTECLRLQGFPDGYLDITYRGKPAFNGPKYRAIGNSWAVTVARWVGDRVDHVLDTITNELKHGIRQQKNAAGPECANLISPTAATNSNSLTALPISDSYGVGAIGVRGWDEAHGSLQVLSPALGDQGGDLPRRRVLEVGQEIKPFLKWAGGKTWAIALLQELYTPHRDRRYYDLTLGSGAIPLALQPDRAYLSDKNPFLIQLWEWVKADGKITLDLNPDKDHYLECRNRFNAGDPNQAQLFYYLNHTCWRGLYRSSKEKFFNVPWGDYKKFHGQTDLSHYKQVIGHWEFDVQSWEYALKNIKFDDFVVFDPPYHSADGAGFTQYFGAFTEADQIAAAEALSNLDVPVVAFNAATDFILDLYRGLNFTIQIEKAPRMISSTGDRAPVSEMVATKNLEQKLVHINNFLEKRKAQPDDTALTTDSCQSDLSYDEERDRIHFERKVDAAFYEAGKALMELRDRRLYRSTHLSWEAYCQDRFGFSHQNGDKKIAAAKVVDVLTTNGCQLLPSSGEQAYPLSKFVDDEQKVEVWEDLTQEGKRPSGKKVRNVVAEICNRQAERGDYHNPWQVGDICQIFKKGDATLAKYDGCWSIVSEVKVRQCVVKVWNGSEVLVKAENLEELIVGEEFLAVCDRVRSLMIRHMDGAITLSRGNLRFLEALGEQSVETFELDDIELLNCIEAKTSDRDPSLVQAARLIADNASGLTDDEARSLILALQSTHGL